MTLFDFRFAFDNQRILRCYFFAHTILGRHLFMERNRACQEEEQARNGAGVQEEFGGEFEGSVVC